MYYMFYVELMRMCSSVEAPNCQAELVFDLQEDKSDSSTSANKQVIEFHIGPVSHVDIKH